MIAPLRRWHRRIFLLLAVLLPLVMALAFASRRPPPVEDRLPELEWTGTPLEGGAQ